MFYYDNKQAIAPNKLSTGSYRDFNLLGGTRTAPQDPAGSSSAFNKTEEALIDNLFQPADSRNAIVNEQAQTQVVGGTAHMLNSSDLIDQQQNNSFSHQH